jgi:hypothetical protein
MIPCKNCNAEFDGKFCPYCGQKAKTGRITISQVAKDLQNQVVHVEQGFLYTLRELILRPGIMLRDFIAGKRVKHIKPVKFLVWATAISFLIVKLLGFQEHIINQIKAQQQIQDNSPVMSLLQKIGDWVNAHPSVIMLFTVPFIGLASWLLFRKRAYNYAEHFTAAAYLMGMINLFSIVVTIVLSFFKHLPIQQLTILSSIQWLFNLTYFGWTYGQWMGGDRPAWTRFKGAMVVIGGYFLMIIATALITSTLLTLFETQVDAFLSQ